MNDDLGAFGTIPMTKTLHKEVNSKIQKMVLNTMAVPRSYAWIDRYNDERCAKQFFLSRIHYKTANG
jgi:hypothetical protein